MSKGPRVNLEGVSVFGISHSKDAFSNPISASLLDSGCGSLFSDEAQAGTSSSFKNFSIRCMLIYAGQPYFH